MHHWRRALNDNTRLNATYCHLRGFYDDDGGVVTTKIVSAAKQH